MATHRSEFYLFVACARNTYHQTLWACIDSLWGFLHIFGVCIKILLDHKTSFGNLCTFLRKLIYENNSFRQTDGRNDQTDRHTVAFGQFCIFYDEKNTKNVQLISSRCRLGITIYQISKHTPVADVRSMAWPQATCSASNNNNNNHLVQWQWISFDFC